MKRLTLFGFLLLGQAANAVAVVRMLWAILVGSEKARVIAIFYDQLANAAFNGSEDETVSSRAGRARAQGRFWGCILCGLLDRIDKDHCTRSAGT